MIQLAFQPAFDPFHTIFRLLRLRSLLTSMAPLPRDHIRVLDFYLLFPFRISEIRLIPQHRQYKKLASAYENTRPYGEQPADQIVFARMGPIQDVALQSLGLKEYLRLDDLRLGQVCATSIPVPIALAERIIALNEKEADLLNFLKVLAFDYTFMGNNGLKDRTGLLEHRYDAV